jgi:hypothetical protein
MDGGMDGHSDFNRLSAMTQTPKQTTCYVSTLDFITFYSRKKIMHVISSSSFSFSGRHDVE